MASTALNYYNYYNPGISKGISEGKPAKSDKTTATRTDCLSIESTEEKRRNMILNMQCIIRMTVVLKVNLIVAIFYF